MPGFFMLNGKLHDGADLVAGPDNRGLRFGDGSFETIRHTGHSMPLFDEHMHRFFTGAQFLGFEMPKHLGPEELSGMIDHLLRKNRLSGTARIRLMAFRKDGGIHDPIDDHPQILIQCWALPDNYSRLNENGLQLGVYHGAVKAVDGLSSIKHNNFLPYLLAAREAKSRHWNDALLLNPSGHIADSTIANLFWVKEGQLFTPPLSDGPVSGVFRRHLMGHLKEVGSPVEERSVTPDQLQEADEVFLTNALFGIRSVGGFGEAAYGHDLTARLYREYVRPLFGLPDPV
jgi:branched-chain amino acid aminotransferase